MGVKKASLEAIWSHAAAKLRPSAEAMAAAAAAVKAADKEAERARLWPLVEKLANRRDLLDHTADTAQALGVVGERKSIKANYIAMSSRVLAEPRVLSIVETGVSSVGKSHLMNTVAQLLPPECIEVITSGSPKSLVFMVERRTHAHWRTRSFFWARPRFIAGSDTRGQPFGRAGARAADRRPYPLPHLREGDNGQFVTRKIDAMRPISH